MMIMRTIIASFLHDWRFLGDFPCFLDCMKASVLRGYQISMALALDKRKLFEHVSLAFISLASDSVFDDLSQVS